MSHSTKTAPKTASKKAPRKKAASKKAPAAAKAKASSDPVDFEKVRAARKGQAAPASKPAETVTYTPADATNGASRATIAPVSATQAPADETPQLELGPAFAVSIDVEQLAPMVSIAPTKESRPYLNAVLLHKAGDALRLVSSDGHRMLVQSIEHEGELPWAEGEGVLLPSEELARILKYTGKSGAVELVFGENHPHVAIETYSATFRVKPVDAKFPPYARILEKCGDVFSAERPLAETSAVNPKHLKSAGQVASLFKAQGVFCYMGDPKAEIVFTFAGVPGVVLVQMPLDTTGQGFDPSVARLIGASGMKGTLAALKANVTRNENWAKEAKTDADRERFTLAAARLQQRIGQIMAGLELALEHKKGDAE